MSKVVHLSNEAHAKAKAFCEANQLRMSEWVAVLIEEALQGTRKKTEQRPAGIVPVQKRKLPQMDEKDERDPAEVFTAPPFWMN